MVACQFFFLPIDGSSCAVMGYFLKAAFKHRARSVVAPMESKYNLRVSEIWD